MTIVKEYTGILIRGRRLTKIAGEARRGLPRPPCPMVRFWTQWQQALESRYHTLYVVSSLGYLTNAQELSYLRQCEGAELKLLAFVDDLPVESIPEHLCRLRVRSDKRVHLVQTHGAKATETFLTRFVGRLCGGPTDNSIIDAWWEGDELVVLSPSFLRLRVPVGSLPAKLRDADEGIRKNFQIDQYGDFLYWPKVDVHMGWEQFTQAVDPVARLRAEQKSKAFNTRYGRAIRRLREASSLKQSDIGGLDERTVRRIEQGRTRATANAIVKLAKAHSMDASQYTAELARYL
ncbi:MAG: helix-turn-helix transcriptional regulator [Planctomycetes bacterium]|nr:helix-turn-helix transcriptional regulator [Planctomycetota bacterium]